MDIFHIAAYVVVALVIVYGVAYVASAMLAMRWALKHRHGEV